MAIVLAVGKKGSGKSAVLRKLVCAAVGQKSVIFYHDPQAQLSTAHSRVYESAQAWANDPAPPYLSIFRGCEAEEVAALALRVGDVTVVLDEMDRACAEKRWLAPSVRKIVHEGRHYRCGLWGTFRRTSNVAEDLVSQCDYVFLFRTSATSPVDLTTVRQRFGEPYADAVQSLDVGQFVVWTDD